MADLRELVIGRGSRRYLALCCYAAEIDTVFVLAIGGQLELRLEPELQNRNPPGWTIRVSAVGRESADYAMVATPPYRFSNPRYIDTGYGLTGRQALAWSPREFAFVATEPDYAAAMRAIGLVLWPGNNPKAEVEMARDALTRLASYPGVLRIEDGRATPPNAEDPLGAIDWMRFRVDLCVPDR